MLATLTLSAALSVIFAQEPGSSPDIREVNHKEATQLLSNLHFFDDGRGMALSPNFLNLYTSIAKIFNLSNPQYGITERAKDPLIPFAARWGMIDYNKEIKGFFKVPYKGFTMGVLGCPACHAGKAAGIFIPGLGNKTIDVGQIGRDAYRAQRVWNTFSINTSIERQILEDRAIDFARRLRDDRYTNLTQGMVPVSLVFEWFFKNQNEKIPQDYPRAAVKVPSFFGYGEKRKVGQFCDGLGDGEHPGWGLLVELVGGQSVDGAKKLMARVEEVEDKIGNILPPKYPFEISSERSSRGQNIFEARCSGCHGTYENDDQGHPIFKEASIYSI